MNLSKKIFCWMALGALSFTCCVRGEEISLQKNAEQGWDRILKNYFSPKTQLIYACTPDRVIGAKHFTNGMLVFSEKNGKGYGHGMEDCAISGGVALSMLCDRYAVTREERLISETRRLAEGVCSLATIHGVKGYVVRGICVEDGKSVCTLSSRDQVTHFIHGLWRYYHSPLSDEQMRAKIRTLFADVAERMIQYVTPENDYNFMMLNGEKDPRGVCKMWKGYNNEDTRLPMIYAAAWDVTKNKRYKDEYLKYIDAALVKSFALFTDEGIPTRKLMPDYSLLQMNSSLEVMLACESNWDRKRAIRVLMFGLADMAADRAKNRGIKDGWCLCAVGELALVQLMTPRFPYEANQQKILREALRTPPLAQANPIRIVHLSAAYWKSRVKGIQLE